MPTKGLAPVNGLVLAGGRSTRMKRDKAALVYDGSQQLQRTYDLLLGRVGACFVSVRAEQTQDSARARYPQIVDEGPQNGPIAGILAAQSFDPNAAWLVVACDLPFLTADSLDHLLANRDAEADATAYRSAHDGLPEPLCAIYEPRSREGVLAHVAAGRSCPRKFLLGARTTLLAPLDPHALDNVNSGAEYWDAMQRLKGGATSLRVDVQYYALLREQAGRSAESVTTAARTARELYDELREKHRFTLPGELLRVAVNAEFGDWSQPLVEGDSVVFIPPVAGG